jgi:hypothetical protein
VGANCVKRFRKIARYAVKQVFPRPGAPEGVAIEAMVASRTLHDVTLKTVFVKKITFHFLNLAWLHLFSSARQCNPPNEVFSLMASS